MTIGITKRRLTLSLLEVLEPILAKNKGAYRFEESGRHLLKIVDIDPSSDQFFLIKQERVIAGWNNVEYAAKPWNFSNVHEGEAACKTSELTEVLNAWFELVRRYSTQSVLDDPRLWGYEKEFHDEYTLADEDADTATFSYEQQLLLDRYLEVVSQGVEGMRDENNSAFVDELKKEVDDARDALTKETKNSIMRRLGRLWARSRLAGLKYSNWMVKTFMEGVVRAGGGEAFKWVSENVHRIPKLIEAAKGMIESNGS